MDNNFNFTPPPECPVFRPTKEEFRDPLEYIDQIKPIAIKSGICKIIPPEEWRPPFSVNVNTFQFTPRVQKLYELEAQSRVKLNFMTKLSQFVRLQGNDKLKIPNINGQHVDLYQLHRLVHDNGGYDHVTANKLWPKIGNKLGYKLSNQVYTLRTHYEKIILPYDMMVASSAETLLFNSDTNIKPRPVLHPSTTKKRKSLVLAPIDPALLESSNELKGLQFVGAGPRMLTTLKDELKLEEEMSSGPLKRRCLSDIICKICGSGDREDRLLICDNDECQDSYHCECLVPPIVQIPKQSWKCQNCVFKVLNKKPVEYGFPSSSTTYTLYDFGRSADRFKANYFAKELHEVVPCSTVEKEFWRILQSFNDDVIVEYGADIHSSHQGSGFPTAENMLNGKCARNNGELNMDLATKYSKEPWNLNNLPVNKRSILGYIRGNIDGMKIPWCYVGMVFSSFCWHIEDHWSFSINYLHWGEPKTWYGVSSENAVQFETAMKKQAPELFENHEDLLHHITTTMNPNILQREGVPVYRTDQHAGQFVVTFPRAYHTGFNQGFNFAEAVNFCPATWLPMGRACISHYAQLRRHCVFSHEELLCTIAEAALLEMDDEVATETEMATKYSLVYQLGVPRDQISLDTNIRRVVHSELEIVIDDEEQHRAKVEKLGLTKSVRCAFENMGDDERACCVCQTTCFLSAIECHCVIDSHNDTADEDDDEDDEAEMEDGEVLPEKKMHRIVCLRHVDDIGCPCLVKDCTLIYRFTLDELRQLSSGLEVRLQDFHSWESDIKAHFTEGPVDGHRRASLDQLRQKLDEGAECGFDSCEEYVKARGLLERGENLSSVCAYWLRAIQETDDCTKAMVAGNGGTVPKSVLVDCVHRAVAKDDQSPVTSVEIKNINVTNLSEENLRFMSQTLARFPLTLPCQLFDQMVTRLLQWRQDCHGLMDSYHTSHGTDPGSLLPKVVTLFEEARRLFPGWSPFANERTCLMLIGKSLQWLVRIRECEDAVKKGKTAHMDLPGDHSLSLPVTLVKDTTLADMVHHGESLVATVRDTAAELATGGGGGPGNFGTRFLAPMAASVDAGLSALYEVLNEINRVRDEAAALPKKGPVSAQVLSSLRSVTEHCLCMGVRVKEVDDARARVYKSCVEAILATTTTGSSSSSSRTTGPRFVALEHASQLMQLGGSLFSESVLDRDNGPLTQRHLAAKAQVALVTRAVRRLRLSCIGPAGDDDKDYAGKVDQALLRVLLPRHFSADDTVNSDRLGHNCAQFVHGWQSPGPCAGTDGHVTALLSLYQAMMTDELASLDRMSSTSSSTEDDHCHHCRICGQPSNDIDRPLCRLCGPRSLRPTIALMADLNRLLRQCPTIVSVYGIALQSLSKRTVTWLESLVTVLRLNARYLSRHYWSLDKDNNTTTMTTTTTTVPACIRDLFSGMDPATTTTTSSSSADMVHELHGNLSYLAMVGHCLEVNIDSYLAVIQVLLDAISQEMPVASSGHRHGHQPQ